MLNVSQRPDVSAVFGVVLMALVFGVIGLDVYAFSLL